MARITRFLAPLAGAAVAMWPAVAHAQDDAGGAVAGMFGLCCSGIFAIIGIAFFAFWIWMLIDAIKRSEEQFTGGATKIIWIILLFVFSYIAAIVYYFVIYKKLGKA